jgi:AcrR family transcriptional regulator
MSEQGRKRRGRPRGFDVDAALDRAIEVFWTRGYVGAGLSELTVAMGINPPSLYAAFGDKRGLFLAALGRYAATTGTVPLAALRAADGPAEKVRAFLRATVDLAYDRGRGRGCLAACVAGDAAGDDEVIRARLDALLRDYEAALGDAAGAGAPSGRVLLAAMHAIAVRARAGAPRRDVEELADDLLDQLGGAA